MIKAITGTKDILPDEISNWINLENIVRTLMKCFNYKEIRTPIFEETKLFSRGIGDSTDIVSKEMYTFLDRSEQSVTLKPEMTASVVRSYIQHSLGRKQSLNKLFYISPMFRQEKPQAGRFRQFNQFGAEALGSNDPSLDAEMIILSFKVLHELGLKNNVIKINSLGIPESRENYKKILRNYLTKHLSDLSNESQKRYDSNVLRIFDSKDKNDQKIMEDAPLLMEHLDDESLEHFEVVKKALLNARVPFVIDPRLVRGLDYYTHTTFEIISKSVGSQSALCGGGRYNLLVKQLGGDDTPGVGFAAGIERILLACENEKSLNLEAKPIDIYIVRVDKNLSEEAFNTALQIRNYGLTAELDYLTRSVKAQMREANKYSAKYVLFVGGDEYSQDQYTLKNMSTGEQEVVSKNDIQLIINKI